MKAIAVCAALAAGAVLGALGQAALSRPARGEPVQALSRPVRGEPVQAVGRSAAPPMVACSASLAPADLAALRTELAALIDERLGGAPRPPAPAPRHEPSAEAVAAATSANQVLDAALASGTWKTADRATFRTAIVAMDAAQRSAAMSRLLTALNEGHLRSEVTGPIL
jgi:hypothetical protein